MLHDSLPTHDYPRRGAAPQYWQEPRESGTRAAPESEADVRARLCALVESADDATASQDLDGRIIHWSDAAERLLGFNARESVGASAMRISTLSGRNPARAMVACLTSGRPIAAHTTRLFHKEGWMCPVLLRTVPTRDATGEICGAMHIARNIGERRRTKAWLEHLVRSYPSIGLAARRDYGERLANLLMQNSNVNTESAARIVALERYCLLSDALGIDAAADLQSGFRRGRCPSSGTMHSER